MVLRNPVGAKIVGYLTQPASIADQAVETGAHFGVEHHLRITHGLEPGYLDAALASITRVLAGLR